MSIAIYPKLERSCPNVNHCPHLGGASVVSVARVANRSEETRESLLHQLRVLEEYNSKLFSDVVALQNELEQTKLELRLERQNKFATNKQKDDNEESQAGETPKNTKSAKKRGAPVGHPGWFRQTPAEYDWEIEVNAPGKCPTCGGKVTELDADPLEHLQEDLIEGRYRVVLYRQASARCPACDCCVWKPGNGEVLNSRIGPGLRSKAVFLRNQIGIS